MTTHGINGQTAFSDPVARLEGMADGSPMPDGCDAPPEFVERPPWPDDADRPRLTLARIIHRCERRERGEEDRVTRCVWDREICPRTNSPDLLQRNSLVHPSPRSLRSPR